MELEFDKEIDALLRKARSDGPVMTGAFVSTHLDADELSAFADNAMPGKTRALHIAHLADCDRCRKILSSLVMFNSETPADSAAVVAPSLIAAESVPWYRKLFALSNLAYGMGALVLVFSGFIGYTLLTATGSREASISQMTETQSAHGPMASESSDNFAKTPDANASASNAAASSANTANSSTNTAVMSAPAFAANATANRMSDDRGIMLDGAAAEKPALPSALKEEAKADNDKQPAASAADSITRAERESRGQEKDQKLAKNMPVQQQVPRGPSNAVSGPSQMNVQRDNRVYDTADDHAKMKAEPPPKALGSTSGKRQVSGKEFEFKQNVWYDTAYRGQATTNVRRNTDDYRKLDSGLRVIAESLSGTVVVVWKDKAFRIQ